MHCHGDLMLFVGCAGWNIHRRTRELFAAEGTHLSRYAARLGAVEINSSFYRPHRAATYARWASSVPAQFRFATKMPKAITHERRLEGVRELLQPYFDAARHLGERLGPVLIQTPPSLEFQEDVAAAFFRDIRRAWSGQLVFEPRHRSWFSADVEQLLIEHEVARVAADPAAGAPEAAEPGGWSGLAYYRLHGWPHVYYSTYRPEYLASLADRLRLQLASGKTVWCVFDNTALGAAASNALDLIARLDPHG